MKQKGMRSYVYIIVLFLISCTRGNNNEQKNIYIDGNKVKALSICFEDFKHFDYPIERYEIEIEENDEVYIFNFMPEIVDYEAADYGHQGFGNSVFYWVSKKTFQIDKKYFGR